MARFDGFSAIGLAGAAVAVAPVLALAVIAMQGDGASFGHVLNYVAGDAARETIALLAGVAACVLVVGVVAAWIVTAYEFPGRRAAEVALLLPLALPAYVLAYAWLDLTHPIGPLQTALRGALGYANPADLRLPDLRSLPGAVFVFGLSLYPYVYIGARAAFQSRISAQVEAARLLGARESGVFFRVALPLARPAMAAGAALALMETLNDIGAAEFLSVTTLTTTVYATWINRSDLPGAAQIALAMLWIVLTLVFVERWARGARGYAPEGARRHNPARAVGGPAGIGLLALALAPPALGFATPAVHLARQAAQRVAANGFPPEIAQAALNTIVVALAATVICVVGALVAVAGRRYEPTSLLRNGLLKLSTLGYAVPGTVLAIGLLSVLGGFDSVLRAAFAALGAKPPGLLLSASVFAVVVALTIRFFRLAVAKIETGFERLPLSLDHSARVLGRTPFAMLREIHLPLLTPSIAGAALLVFVDCMKELPATLLLRPLNFETLSTQLYGEAARGAYENGAVAACLIVLVGLFPVAFLTMVGSARAIEATRPRTTAELDGAREAA